MPPAFSDGLLLPSFPATQRWGGFISATELIPGVCVCLICRWDTTLKLKDLHRKVVPQRQTSNHDAMEICAVVTHRPSSHLITSDLYVYVPCYLLSTYSTLIYSIHLSPSIKQSGRLLPYDLYIILYPIYQLS